MRKIPLVIFLLTSMIAFGQDLKEADKVEFKACTISKDFEEPERDKKTKKWAKKMNKFGQNNFPSLEDIKSHVAIDNDCEMMQVVLIRLSEQAGNGIYIYCVNGMEMKYKRMGTVIMRNGKNPLSEN